MPIAAKLEKVLLDAANGTYSGEALSEEIQMYSKDLDTSHLVTQLQMLPELIQTMNVILRLSSVGLLVSGYCVML